MAAQEGLNMEAFQTMMRAWVDGLSTNQKEENRKKIEELK